jgi:hypothetical protein
VEPLTGQRHVEVTERRTRKEWAHFIKGMLDERYPDAIKVRLVMDNFNTHDVASLYKTFAPEEALRLAKRLDIHDTPKHAEATHLSLCLPQPCTEQSDKSDKSVASTFLDTSAKPSPDN